MNLVSGGIGAEGIILDAIVGVSEKESLAIQSTGKVVPNGVRVRALLDTGASHTCVCLSVASKLGLAPVGESPCRLPNRKNGGDPIDLFAARIDLQTYPNITTAENFPVGGLDLEDIKVGLLIGRDILSISDLSYDGRTRRFTLSFRPAGTL